MSGEPTLPALVVALGASNTEGYGVGARDAYPAMLEALLRARGQAVEVRNAGISGNTTGDMLARLAEAVPARTRAVIFQPGSNDVRRGLSEATRAANIAAIQAWLAERGIAVVRVTAAFEAARAGHLQVDGIHFTAAGHARIAELILDEVAAALTT